MANFISNRKKTISIGISNYTEGSTVLDATGNVSISGIVTAKTGSAVTYYGDGSNLTGLTGASAATYGDGSNVAQIVVNSDGKITGISEVAISGGGGGGGDVVDDTTPQLGGDLDLNSNDITGTGNLNITGIATFSGNVTIGGTLTYEDVTNIDSVGLITARSGIIVNSGGINVSAGIVTAPAFTGFDYLQAPHGTTVNYAVTVAAKTAAHRYNGSGSSNGYVINGVESPFLTFTPGRTYRFTLSSGDMSSHPFRFYLEADKTTQYTTNVTSTSTYTEIVVTDITPIVLHYQCSAHDYMGNAAQTNSNKLNTPYQIDGLKGANITGVVTATSLVKSGGTSSQFLKADGSVDTSTYLTSYTETDPVVGAISGIVKADGGGNISTATAGTDYLTPSGDGSSLTGLTGASAATYGDSSNVAQIVVDSNGRITGISEVTISGGGGGGDVVDDTTPQLGGDLDLNSNDITGTGDVNITGIITATLFFGDGSNLTGIGTNFNGASKSVVKYIAGANQTTFVASYAIGYVDVYLNGVKLTTDLYTSTSGTSIVLNDGAAANDVIEIISFTFIEPSEADSANNVANKASSKYTATDGQTSFAATYEIGYVDVYLNGVKLTDDLYDATSGSAVILNDGAATNDIVEIIAFTFNNFSGVGIATAGGTVGTGVTLFDFRGPGISTVTVSSGIGTINIKGSLTIGTRTTAQTINMVGVGATILLRSGIGTLNF
jgi:hypothetical protein